MNFFLTQSKLLKTDLNQLLSNKRSNLLLFSAFIYSLFLTFWILILRLDNYDETLCNSLTYIPNILYCYTTVLINDINIVKFAVVLKQRNSIQKTHPSNIFHVIISCNSHAFYWLFYSVAFNLNP